MMDSEETAVFFISFSSEKRIWGIFFLFLNRGGGEEEEKEQKHWDE